MNATEPDLNLKEVAARLGVHYMTVYRYVRQGRLAAHRVGTAWRVRSEAVDDFVAVPAAPRGGADWVARLVPPLQSGDEPAAWAVVQAALASGSDATSVYVDILIPAVARISRGSGPGDSEHLMAMTVAHRLVARIGAQFRRPGRKRGSVVLGAPLGERHALPVAIVADVLRFAGFEVWELGVDVEPAAFADAASRAPRLVAVGLSVTSVDRLDAAREAVEAVRLVAPGVAVMVGGQGILNPEVAALLGADVWAPDARSVVEMVEHVTSNPRTPVTAAP